VTEESIYLSALLHDIGKLIERSKVYENKKVNELFSDIKYSHARYTAFFLKTYSEKVDWLGEQKSELLQLSSYHHNPKNEYGKIIQLADWLASSERVEDIENTSIYNTVQLRSILGTLNKQSIIKYYRLKELSFPSIFTYEKNEAETREYYHKLSENMISEFRRVENKEDLFFILEKYLSFVPAQTTKNDPDISLFDHSKLTAAIALCFYYQKKEGKLNDVMIENYRKKFSQLLKIDKEGIKESEKREKIIKFGKENLCDEHFILLNADLSGIQKFIFNIPSKGAAKSLKGRSTYLILIMEAICDFIIRNLELEKANIIYNGGGNFYILIPAAFEEKIKILRKEINQILLDSHQGKLFCNIGYTKIKLYEFKDFKDVWKRASEETSKIKQRKLSEIWKENYENLFEQKELIADNKFCSVCHSTNNVETYEDNRLCSLCYSFEELTKDVAKAKFYNFSILQNKEIKEVDYKSILNRFGFNIDFKEKAFSNEDTFILNEFSNEQILKWKLGAFNLPIDNNRNIKTFEELAGKNGKLAYLKLDVDNLGQLFIKGLEKSSLSRMAVLSRILRMFFEGYLPYFIKQKGLEDKIYIVFSGGDDTFLIGDVEIILRFAKEFREKFKEFVCENPKISFSAGIGIFRYNFPVIKAAQITEQYLEKAKSFVYPENKGKSPEKNKIVIFDEVFNWDELNYILELRDEIKKIVGDKEKHRRSVIQKIINSTKGFKPILEQSQNGKMDMRRVWRLSYYLRELKDEKDAIIKIYEDMWLKNLFKEERIKNHQIITVAAKLADLETRRMEE
jgi:CRISPR-associated protein Csm1